MFSLLRFILIVGAIFYFSPVRDRGEEPVSLDGLLDRRSAETKALPEDAPGRLEMIWNALPDGAKQAVIEKIVAGSSGLAPLPEPVDTLKPSDRHPPPRGQIHH